MSLLFEMPLIWKKSDRVKIGCAFELPLWYRDHGEERIGSRNHNLEELNVSYAQIDSLFTALAGSKFNTEVVDLLLRHCRCVCRAMDFRRTDGRRGLNKSILEST